MSYKRNIILAILILMHCLVYAQLTFDSITDTRDGRIYETVSIDSTTWFRDNLMLKTAHSFYPNIRKKESCCPSGNYYSYYELETLCPVGWRIPTEIDWQNYITYRLESQSGSIVDVHLDTLYEEYMTVVYRDTSNKVKLLDGVNPLGISKVGWVQGRKVRDWGTTTFWIRKSNVDDHRFHLHVNDKNYTIHRHKHNVDDVRRKTRKFMVKCVSDQ